jgi:ppGpp synthetase/RelA/SpoT-type nucleotidyltranferase
MKNSKRLGESLEDLYRKRYEALKITAIALQAHVSVYFTGVSRIDRITARAKDVKSFLDKAAKKEKGKSKYGDPLNQIQDQLGVRVVTFFRSDVDRVDDIVKKYFRWIEHKDHVPESEWELATLAAIMYLCCRQM